MGGNDTHNPSIGGIAEVDRTHNDTHLRIDGHKILVQKIQPKQVQVPMNSNSESPIYLCARKLKSKPGEPDRYEIASIGIYKNHKIVGQIDLSPDKDGNVKPYSATEKSMHYHNFSEIPSTGQGRKSGQKDNHHPIPDQFKKMVDKVINFNKKQRE